MTSDASVTRSGVGRSSVVPALAAAVPCALAVVAVVMFSVSELVGHTWLSPGVERNLAEAAAMGRLSEVARFLRNGDDPQQIVEVRPHVISSSVTRVSALEAAVWHRSAALMALFDRADAIADPSTRRHLTCLASDLRADDVVRYFVPEGSPGCMPGEALQVVLARSQSSVSRP